MSPDNFFKFVQYEYPLNHIRDMRQIYEVPYAPMFFYVGKNTRGWIDILPFGKPLKPLEILWRSVYIKHGGVYYSVLYHHKRNFLLKNITNLPDSWKLIDNHDLNYFYRKPIEDIIQIIWS